MTSRSSALGSTQEGPGSVLEPGPSCIVGDSADLGGFLLCPVAEALLESAAEEDVDEPAVVGHFEQGVDGLLVAFAGDVDDFLDGFGQGGGGGEVHGPVGDGLALELFVVLRVAHDGGDDVDLVLVADPDAFEEPVDVLDELPEGAFRLFPHDSGPSGGDALVFVDESDAAGWRDGTKVQMVVESGEATINGETTEGWLGAASVDTIP